MISKERKKIVTSIALPPTLRAEADRLAELQDRTFGSVVRQALKKHLEEQRMLEGAHRD